MAMIEAAGLRIECPEHLLPEGVDAASADVEMLAQLAERRNREVVEQEVRVKAWFVLWLLERVFPPAVRIAGEAPPAGIVTGGPEGKEAVIYLRDRGWRLFCNVPDLWRDPETGHLYNLENAVLVVMNREASRG